MLTPAGYPCWKIRFTPTMCGTWRYSIRVRDGSGERSTKPSKFLCIASPDRGFITVSKADRRYFSFTDGSFFYPLGLNVRSPTDTRFAALMKRKVDPDTGTLYYEQLFSRMRENDENFAEIWMASWFAALEWVENRPGYRGLGYYNLKNAWKLDTILDSARENDIRLQVVLINHGQLSSFCDQEWQDNPYNAKNGGFLTRPEEFFTNRKAQELTRRKIRYIMARWAYSPNIFSWVLINEMNLIGSDGRFYTMPTLGNWYGEIGGYLKENDPWHHPVSGHYTILVDNNLVRSPVVDFVITNAYYDVSKNETLAQLIKRITEFTARFQKPAFISEFGGTPMGGTDDNLVRDIVTGLWTSYHLPLAGAPLFWWHRFVDERGLHGLYKNLCAYGRDMNRPAMDFRQETATVQGAGGDKMGLLIMGSAGCTAGWLWDPVTGGNPANPPLEERGPFEITLSGKTGSAYRVVYWDMEKGPGREMTIRPDAQKLIVPIPPFKKWTAFKIVPVP